MLRSYENYERYQSERDHHFQVDHCGTLCLVTTWPCSIHQQIIFNKNSQHGLISYFFIGKRIYPFFYLFSYTSVFFFFFRPHLHTGFSLFSARTEFSSNYTFTRSTTNEKLARVPKLQSCSSISSNRVYSYIG